MPTEQEQRVRPFSSGTQWLDWWDVNCATCHRDEEKCEIAVGLNTASFVDGTVIADVAERMGFTRFGADHYDWPCLEHDPPFENLEDWAGG